MSDKPDPIAPKRAARFPLWPTVIVLLLAAIMVGLGVWQLQRHAEKTAAIAALRANVARPAVTFPPSGPVGTDRLFRPSSVVCLRVAGWSVQAGSDASGKGGFRYIAQCVTGAEGPGALIALGIGDRPDLKPTWTGGQIAGWISEEPDHRSLFDRLTRQTIVLRPMLVAREGAGGLRAAARPSPDAVPNNHMSYAIQWFLFAATALIIYVIAVLRRGRGA